MKPSSRWFVLFAFISAALSAATPDSSPNIFSLVPKSFQTNPRVEFNIITEMTNEGRKAPQASPATPVYYLSKPGSFVQLGHGASSREKPPAVERMEKVLEAALAQGGYLGASKEHPPSVVIVYSWGSHSSEIDNTLDGSDPSTATPTTVSNEVMINELVERARLVGGERFAQELVKALAEEGAANRASYKPRTVEGGPDALPNTMGDGAGAMTNLFKPVERFRRRSDKIASLLEDASHSVYFVVASAYDFTSATTLSKILLWRTKMSVSSNGIGMTETLPSLITAAAPYFGKDMTEVEVLGQRINRAGSTRLGPLEVKGYYENAAAETPAKEAEPAPAKEPAPEKTPATTPEK